jgi:acetyl esterase/lipase
MRPGSRRLVLPPLPLLALLTLLAGLGVPGLPGAMRAATDGATRLVEDVDYAGAGDPDQTLDLFLPDQPGAPLLVFVHDRFWGRGERGRDVAHRLARPLQRAGAAVAVVRHRPAPEHPHPAGAEDVARAIAFLIDQADHYGYDREKIHLSGHGSGGHLAALVALDPKYLAAHGYTSRGLRGVAIWSGIFDLSDAANTPEMRAVIQPVFGDAAARRAASPIAHVRGDAPTFLLMVAEHDLPDAADQARAFAEALRAAGHPAAEMFMLQGRDHWTGLSLQEPDGAPRQHLLALMELPGATTSLADEFGTRRFWRDPSYTTLPFWKDEKQVVRRDADDRFLFTLNMPFARPGRPPLLRPAQYASLDLLDYVAQHVPGGDGPWQFLTLTNVRGEQVVWRRSEIEPLHPVVVIGLDDERQLFTLTDVYHTNRRYSWKGDAETWVLARPLGAFIYFLEPPPPETDPKLFGRFGLQADAFSVSDEDPLAPLRSLPDDEERILTQTFRCVSCHSFRGVGGKAAHLRARDGEKVGGFALPLESYPPEVWRRYCFEQVDLAAEIGASAVPLGEDATTLFELVERERAR